jgi:transmembrane sensor
VIEGVVEISGSLGRSGEPGAPLTATALLAPRLNAGEEARVGMDGHVVKRAVSDVAKLAAWQAPRLVFEDERLDDIAAEFNRWNRIQIEIREQEIAARLYSGAFNADDPDSLIAFLARDPGLDVRRSKERVVVARRRVQ